MKTRIKANEKLSLAIIENYRGNSDEFAMLKGILCITHSLPYKEAVRFRNKFCTATIARRMDEMMGVRYLETNEGVRK